MLFRLNPSSGLPLYLQLMEQIRHAIETGALQGGDQLPTIRKVAEDLVMNPNTVVRAYRELQHEGIVELKHGSGAYVSESVGGQAKVTRKAQTIVQSALERLADLGLTDDEVRRLVDNELVQFRAAKARGGKKQWVTL
jgi:GntR family transcriptional regulator